MTYSLITVSLFGHFAQEATENHNPQGAINLVLHRYEIIIIS